MGQHNPIVRPLPFGVFAPAIPRDLSLDLGATRGLVVAVFNFLTERLSQGRAASALLVELVSDCAQDSLLGKCRREVWKFMLHTMEQLEGRRDWGLTALGRRFVAVEEDVFGCVRHLWRLIVVVNQDLLRRFVGRCNVGRQKRAVDNNADDLMRLVSKCMSELAELICIVNGQAAEEERAVSRKLLRQNPILRLQRLDAVDDTAEGHIMALVHRRLQRKRGDCAWRMRRAKVTSIACG